MPSWKVHILVAIAFIVALWFGRDLISVLGITFDTTYTGLLFTGIIILFYSTLPDFDTPASKSRRWLSFILLGVVIYAFITNKMVFGLVSALVLFSGLFMKHRGFMHKYLWGGILCAPMAYYGLFYLFVAVVSYYSHLLIDGERSLK